MHLIKLKSYFLVITLALLLTGTFLIEAQAQSDQPDTTQPSSTPGVIELTFPPASDHPASDWRAPLYPIPFALSQHDHFYLDRPISVDSVNWPLPEYRYGYTESETKENPHTGVDIDAALHTPILAAADGKVVFTGYGLALGKGNTNDPYGLAVVIRHDFSFEGQSILTVYGHMEKILVNVGDRVTAGQQIGRVGVTGNTSGPHVHFEVRLEKENKYTVQNPELWMVPPINNGVLVGQIKDVYGYFLTGRELWIRSKNGNYNWTVFTYASPIMNNDGYYNENLALSDLPAGDYEVTFLNNFKYNKFSFSIFPGAITCISYTPGNGFALCKSQNIDLESFLIPVK